MAKLTLVDMTTGYQSAAAYNANNALIEAALENTFSLDGTTPNVLTADIDINSNDILNAGVVNATSIITAGMTLGGIAVTATNITNGLLTVPLDVQAFEIMTSIANGDITLAPSGTGDIILGTLTLDADQVLTAGLDNYVLTYNHTSGKISLEVGGGGGGGGSYWGRIDNTGTNRGGTSGFTISKTAVGRYNVDFTAASLGLANTEYSVTANAEKFSPGGVMCQISYDATDFTINIYDNSDTLADDYVSWIMATD